MLHLNRNPQINNTNQKSSKIIVQQINKKTLQKTHRINRRDYQFMV